MDNRETVMQVGRRAGLPARIAGSTLLTIGLFLAYFGTELLLLGGATYYLIAALLILPSAWFVFTGSLWGDRFYAIFLGITIVFALIEAGFAPWLMMPRIVGPAVIGLLFFLPGIAGQKIIGALPTGLSAVLSIAMLLAFLVTGLVTGARSDPGLAYAAKAAPLPASSEWASYGGGPEAQRHSPLAAINAGNVAALEQAWIHHSGDMGLSAASLAITPLKLGDLVYSCTPSNQIIAIDAVSGKERWRFDPKIMPAAYATHTCRSLASYQAPATSDPAQEDGAKRMAEVCSRRIFVGTLDSRLLAIDARTGKQCRDFGKDGAVDLRDGFPAFAPTLNYQTSGPLVVGDNVIVGGLVLDNQSINAPSGVIRSYDVRTGRLRWAWDMGVPGRVGAPGAGQYYTASTPNAWAPMTGDAELGLVYVPLGNPSPDFFGAGRRGFDEKYGSSLVALSLADGRPRWSFQLVHHDLWDRDVSMQALLADLDIDGVMRQALVQGTKQGDIFLLDRKTGKPIVPVSEKAVPKGGLPEEPHSPTQPYSALSLMPPPLHEADMWGLTPLDQLICRIAFRKARYQGAYTAPGTDTTLIYPGLTGTMSWGGLSYDPSRKQLVANITLIPWLGQLVRKDKAGTTADERSKTAPEGAEMRGTPYRWMQKPFLSPLGVPCNAPPWGKLVGVDIAHRKINWSVPLGTGRDFGPLGLHTGIPLRIGTPNVGGSLTTNGDLVFIGAAMDNYLRAFDLRNGSELWRARLPAGAQATPITFTQGSRQYVVVSSGGHGLLGTTPGDATIAFKTSAKEQR